VVRLGHACSCRFDPAVFDVILVEMDGESYGGSTSVDALKDQRVHERFTRAGMRRQRRIGLNVVYVRADVEHTFRVAMASAA
jgi:hypothetical protein